MFGKKKSVRPEARRPTQTMRQPVSAAMKPSANMQASILEKNAKVATPSRAERPPEGPRRIIPAALFEGETGALLKKLGMSPDDPSNLMPSLSDHQNKINEMQEKERAFIAKINSQLPQSAQIVPYAMIPFQCWTKGPHAKFLYDYLGFYPFGPWNLLLMPKTDVGAMVLSMTKCPQGVSDAQIAQCNSTIGEIHKRFKLKFEGVKEVAQAGNTDAYDEMPKIRGEAETALMTLAFMMGKAIMGPESFVKCRSMFFGDGELAKLA